MKEIIDRERPMPRPPRFDRDDLLEAVRVMNEGGIILYPTDTVWGIGCDATNEEAVQRIFRLKQRADSKSMLVLLDAPGKLQGYVTVPDVAWQLMELTTKPLTIVYPEARSVAPSLIAEDGSLGIRITEENFSRSLCQRLRHPVVSTSANISGMPAPALFSEISEEVKQGVDYICRFRQRDNHKGRPSSIVKLGVKGEVQIIRE